MSINLLNNTITDTDILKREKLKLQRQIQNQKYREKHGAKVNETRRDKYHINKENPEFKQYVKENRKKAYQKAKNNKPNNDDNLLLEILLNIA